MALDLDKAVVDLEIRPDGTVRFVVSGMPGPACEQLEALLLAALRGEVTEREHTPEYHQQAEISLGQRLKALLGR
ncbi:MAG: DUF2997 domain-containing protein [Pseudomonadota bacterium]